MLINYFFNSEDFKNCEEINKRKGICSKCKEGYYLNKGDNRCTETANCSESSFGKCKTCQYNYYLDKRDNACKKKEGAFSHCKQTLDGKKCDICEDGYYFDEEGNCVSANFCSKGGESGKCEKDIFVPDLKGGCEGAKKCILGNNYCKECEEDSKLCKICEDGYFPDQNGGCSYTNNCEISSQGQCIKCKDNYILIGENNNLYQGFILC